MASRLSRLKVHTRTTAAGKDKPALDGAVFCEREQRFVGLADCLECTKSYGIDRTERDVFLICSAPQQDADRVSSVAPPNRAGTVGAAAHEEPVSCIMVRDVFCVGPGVGVEELAAVLLARNISGVPVVDDAGKPIGVVTKTDLLRLVADQRDDGVSQTLMVRVKEGTAFEIGSGFRVDAFAGYTVHDIMTPIVFSLHHESSIGRAAAMMAFEGVHRVPIVAEDGRVVGLISSLDVLRWFARASGYVIPDHGNLGDESRPIQSRAGPA
jgi:CBS domain-containing protein